MSLTVSEADARRLLSALHPEKPVQDWTAKRLVLKLNDAGLVAGADLDKLADKNDRDLLRRIGRAIEEGEDIVLEDEPKPKEETMSATVEKKAKVEKKKPSPKSTKGKTSPAAAKNGSAKKDKFGAREGSNTAKFNAALGKKPQTMRELVEKAELGERTFYSHVRSLIEAGHVVEEENGFRLKS